MLPQSRTGTRVQTGHVTRDPDLKDARILRRYMDLPKLVDMLSTGSLYLRRADGFSDRLEGALFPQLRKALDEEHQSGSTGEGADDFYHRAREGNFVSCWTLGAKDNMALWQLYGGASTSVAVTTTIGRFTKLALSWKELVFMYRVKYVDHRKVGNFIVGRYTDVLKYKNEAYRYERELRLIVSRQEDSRSNPAGLRLPLPNTTAFVRSVVVAPEAPPWFFDVVSDVCKQYSLISPVRRSSLGAMAV